MNTISNEQSILVKKNQFSQGRERFPRIDTETVATIDKSSVDCPDSAEGLDSTGTDDLPTPAPNV